MLFEELRNKDHYFVRNPVKMSKKPYVIQQGSNNLIIVPTEKGPSPKKVKLDNNNVSEKVPVQVQRESVVNNFSNRMHYGASSINNNVLIDVSKIRRQQNSWASNFLQSIGGTTHKSSRLYHNVATKSTLLRKENILASSIPKINSNSQRTKKEANELKDSRTIAYSASELPKANKEHSYPIKKEDPRHFTIEVDDKPTDRQNFNPCQETVHLKSVQIKTKDKVGPNKSAPISDKYKTTERKKITQLKSNNEALVSKTHKTRTPRKATEEAPKAKPNKEIIKSNIRKETSRVKSDKPTKGQIVLNLKRNKTCEKKNTELGNVKCSYKESKPVNSEISAQKESFISKSPIRSVVKKMNNYHYHSDSHYHKKSNYKQSNSEEMFFKETDEDLRSKLKRKNDHKDDEIRENRIPNKFSIIPKSTNKGFVPDENLIISFNAKNDTEEEKVKENTPVKTLKTKKQTSGGNKCKKIKLEINIILRHGDTTDDESIQSEDDKEDVVENTDVSFLDDINIDEIVDSLNGLKNNTENINTGTSSYIENLHSEITTIDVKEFICINDSAMDNAIENTNKRSNEVSLNDKHNNAFQSTTTTNSQRDTSLIGSVKIEGNSSGTLNESNIKTEPIVKEEISENIPKLDDISDKTAVTNQCLIQETITGFNRHFKEEIKSLPDCTYQYTAETLVSNKTKTSNFKVPIAPVQVISRAENIVEVIDMKTTDLLNNNKTNNDDEDIILTNESNTHVNHQQNVLEEVTIDLTDIEDNLPQKEVDNDVIIVDPEKSCVIEIDTEPILILDTDYDIVSNLNSETNDSENPNDRNVNDDTVVGASGKTSEQITKNANQNTDKNESKGNKAVEKHVVKDKSSNFTERTDENNVVVIKNDDADWIKPNSPESKNDKIIVNTKVKNQAKVLSKDLSTSNNNKHDTKDNESIQNIENSTLVNDKLAKRVEARLQSYLDENHYLTGIIHRGRFSTLYTYDNKNGRKNTVKVLHTTCVEFGLEKENMLMKLQKGVPAHNYNCVRLMNGFCMSRQWCFLMEYYPKNLHDVIDNQKHCFHIDVVLRLSAQLVSAVTILRNNNIIHSDIKPSHILLSDDETKLKLCGFDRAFYHCHDNAQLLPKTGTVNYRAPELIMGYPADYGIDVWSTALVMYEMATRIRLFPGTYNNDILYKQLCTLDDMPPEMHLRSRFRHCYFEGNAFSRVVNHGASRKLIYNFFKKERIHSVLFRVYTAQWAKQRTLIERREDKTKLHALSKLLNQMLVMYPKHRIAIEFVFANPFMYETFDA